MSEQFRNVSSYHHALDSHRDYTVVVQGTGLFDYHDRVDDEFTMRSMVAGFLTVHAGLNSKRLTEATERIVPMCGSFAEECVEGYLPAHIMSRIAAKSMLHYGLEGDYSQMDGVYKAYRSTLEVMSLRRQIVAKSQMHHVLRADTPHISDRLSVLPETDPSVINYRQTLRRLLARNVLSEEVYVQRIEEANLRPIPVWQRRLRVF